MQCLELLQEFFCPRHSYSRDLQQNGELKSVSAFGVIGDGPSVNLVPYLYNVPQKGIGPGKDQGILIAGLEYPFLLSLRDGQDGYLHIEFLHCHLRRR